MAHQSLQMVVFSKTVPVMQVSDFPVGCARSCKGAIHVGPSRTMKLTQSEVEHIKSLDPKLARGMKVVAKVTPPPPPHDPVAHEEGKKAAAKKAAEPSEAASAASAAPSAAPSEPRSKGKGQKSDTSSDKPDGT